jgi:hypothetical protein
MQGNLYKGCVRLCSVNIQKHNFNHLKIVTLNLKLVTLLIRHCHPEKCVMVKALELVNLCGETSDLVTSYVLHFLKKFELMTE